MPSRIFINITNTFITRTILTATILTSKTNLSPNINKYLFRLLHTLPRNGCRVHPESTYIRDSFNNEHITRKRIAETCLLRICVSASLQFGRFIGIEAIEVRHGTVLVVALRFRYMFYRVSDYFTRWIHLNVFWKRGGGTETRLAFNHLFIRRVERERFSPNVEIGEEEFVTKSLGITRVTR